MTGFSREEAGNIIASIMGLDVSKSPKTAWTVKELQHLAFLRDLDIKGIMPP